MLEILATRDNMPVRDWRAPPPAVLHTSALLDLDADIFYDRDNHKSRLRGSHMDLLELLSQFPSLNVNILGSIASIAGLGTQLAQWLLDVESEKDERTLRAFQHWLDAQSQAEILAQLDRNRKHINEQLKRLEVDLKRNLLGKTEFERRSDLLLDTLVERAIERLLNSLPTRHDTGHRQLIAAIRECDRKLGQLLKTAASPSAEFERSFLKQVQFECSTIRMLGIPELSDVDQALDVAYVSLAMSYGTKHSPRRADLVLRQNSFLAIRAAAGAGKTTLLHWIALQCALRQSKPWKGLIPFFVPLRRLNGTGQPDVSDFIDYSIDRKFWAATVPTNWIDDVLRRGRAVILIDGVDELPPSQRPAFWIWLRGLARRYANNRIYVTSRYFPERGEDETDLLWNPPPLFESAELQEMTDHEIKAFVRKWHEAVIQTKEDDRAQSELRAAAEALPVALLQLRNQGVRELCRTPLLCALVCAMHWRERGYLPDLRVELYDRCCRMLMEERDLKRGILLDAGPLQHVRYDDKHRILQRLALSMMRNQSNDNAGQQIEVDRDTAIAWVKLNIGTLRDDRARKCTAVELLDHLIERAGVLREPTTGRVDFVHRSFQEYLAACAAGEAYDVGDLANRAPDDQWHETIILAAGTSTGGVRFGNELIEQLLERGKRVRDKSTSRTYLTLAIACLETARQPDPRIRDAALKCVKKVAPPRSAKEARILSAAGEAVIPYLRKRITHTEKTSALCARTLASIGSETALELLLSDSNYGKETRLGVLVEILKCHTLHPLSVSAVVKMLEQGEVPPEIGVYFQPVRDVTPLATASSLKRLTLSRMPLLTDITALERQQQLQELYLGNLPQLKDVGPLGHLQNLTSLVITRCIAVDDTECLRQLPSLTHLTVNWCPSVESLDSVAADIYSLRSLSLTGCPKLSDLTGIALLPRLRWLYVQRCPKIHDLSPLADSTSLEFLWCDARHRDGTIPEALYKKCRFE